MEQNQNVKKNICEDPIEILWKSNPRIPFMQSKEILRLGFNEGKKSLITEISNINRPSQSNGDSDFVGTSKELIEHANKKINDNKKKVNTKSIEFSVEEARYKLLDEIFKFINDKRDLMETYTKIKNMHSVSQKRYNNLRMKYEQGNGE